MRLLLLSVLLAISFIAHARIGLAETTFQTPGGHTICDCDPYENTPVLIGFEQTFNQLETWYFYKDHIVGKTKNFYFIFDESTKSPQFFKEESEWKNAIQRQGLTPLYTRWLTIGDAPDLFLFMVILSIPTWGPILLITLIAIIVLTVSRKIIWNKRTWTIAAALLLSVALLFDYHLNVNSV